MARRMNWSDAASRVRMARNGIETIRPIGEVVRVDSGRAESSAAWPVCRWCGRTFPTQEFWRHLASHSPVSTQANKRGKKRSGVQQSKRTVVSVEFEGRAPRTRRIPERGNPGPVLFKVLRVLVSPKNK